MSRLIGSALIACFLCIAAPLRLNAQGLAVSPVDTTVAAAPAAAGTTQAPAASESSNVAPVGAHYATPARTTHDMAAARSQLGLGQARALMIVGAAGVLVGAIVGGQAGTVIMVSGAVVGLVGLYEYMQ